ncbi:MAG TPA: porphobilinogen synthase [Rhabdochlamydiaceae bacterium]|nr:porphobilinogen synthase [Rhabdochlamydiaceae bacterium]
MLIKRPRRNRKTVAIRSLVRETVLLPSDLAVPFFVLEGTREKQAISSMPGIHRMSADLILAEAEILHSQGIPAIALFPVIDPLEKDPFGQAALDPEGVLPKTIKMIKQELPSLCVITDVALDPYTSHGHDGIIDESGDVLNDATVEILAHLSLLHAESGVDFVAPSDMMDGRVLAIRQMLDRNQFENVGIIAYTAKYASSLYFPFRDALQSGLKFGDKKTYQMNPSNSREAILEAHLDAEEGADILMVKPALFYLDIISKMRAEFHLPISAFHVSGEYAMVMAAHERGFLDAGAAFYEALLSIKRAGADFIFTYAAPFVLEML